MKILILGASGNLGTQLVDVFSADEENDVTAWDREQIDVRDEELVAKKVSDLKPDVIINAVAYTAADKCEVDEDEYDLAKELNIDVPRYIAKAALENDAVFVHFSSDYSFDGSGAGVYEEDYETRSVNRYGKTKLLGEKAIIKMSSQGLKWYLIRTSKLFGPKGDNENAKESFFDLMTAWSEKKDELNLVDEELSCFTYTPDLAKEVKKIIEDEIGFGIYHIVNEGAVTWYGGLVELFKMKGVTTKINPIKSEDLKRPAKRPVSSVLKNTKLEPLRDWKEALSEYLGISKD
ncbi:MAG: NAD(P)-dependent oxidoreductase [Patescibacteria group bacterium]|jgi:dTDP-4-dehydrorhamnose reductase|nr:NAD(P)-dependent oxidoreductase [Patescibacteria group bacterium]